MRHGYRTMGLSVPITDVLNPQLWRERYAWGVALGGGSTLGGRLSPAAARSAKRLTDELPDDTIRWHLRCAVSELELKLGMPLGLEVCKARPVDDGLILGTHYDREVGRLPYTRSSIANYYGIGLPSGVISVERVRGYYLDTKVFELSSEKNNLGSVILEWGQQGAMHILPVDLGGWIISVDGDYGVWWMIHNRASPLPDFWAIDYTRGPVSKHGGEPGRIEAALAHWCYCAAGILLLSQAGIAQSKGLSSTSLSIDGVSRSVGLQASAIYGLNSALEHVYEEATKRLDWRRIRAAKRGPRIFPLGS